MPKKRAFLDTTILVDSLLKVGPQKAEADAALKMYSERLIPQYAIKEFKAGALDGAKYAHNKLLDIGELGATLQAIARNIRQKNKVSTALDLIGQFITSAAKDRDPSLVGQYGSRATFANTLHERLRLDLKLLIFKAWVQRKSIGTQVNPLPCYTESDLTMNMREEIVLNNTACRTDNCCMTADFRNGMRFDITRLKVAIDNMPDSVRAKKENQKRLELLHAVQVDPQIRLTDSQCRTLGDVVFALYCPKNADVLTTNLEDHKPLAEAVDKHAVSPKELLAAKATGA